MTETEKEANGTVTQQQEERGPTTAAGVPADADATETVETAVAASAQSASEQPENGDPLALARARAADFEDRWKRAAAEFINYKRRTEQERAETQRRANSTLILDLLPVLDDLERALANVPDGEAEDEWVKGTRLVQRKFHQILERQGVTAIEAVGQPFDPALHEAVGGAGSVVAREYQRGYKLHDRVLRPSMVLVGEAEPAATEA